MLAGIGKKHENNMHAEPRVWNWHTPGYPKDAVNIMRPTKWGNPFSHWPGCGEFYLPTRNQCVAAYKEWILDPKQAALLEALKFELRGKHLLCCCVPKMCHGNIILELANETPIGVDLLFA